MVAEDIPLLLQMRGIRKVFPGVVALAATVAQYQHEMGKAAVETALKAIRGEAVPSDIGVRIELVTKENARQ